MRVKGGPFDCKVTRDGSDISLTVVGDKGDIITQITFSAARIDDVILALMGVKECSSATKGMQHSGL